MMVCGSKMVTVVRYSASLRGEWDAFVKNAKNSTFLFRRAYMDYNPRITDHSLMFYSGAELVALLPANIDGDVLESHGGLTYGGMVLGYGAGVEDVMLLFAAMRDYLRGNTAVNKVVYRPLPHIYEKYPAEEALYALFRYDARLLQRKVSSAVWLRGALPLSTLRRRKAKQAAKAGFAICEDSAFAPFWDVLQSNLQERHGLRPVHSLGEIMLLASLFPQNIRLFRVVNSTGDTVAGALLYVTARVAHVQYIASSPEGRASGALDYLFAHLIGREFADKEYFDFGNSVEQGGRYLNKGLIFQKEGFGARAVVYDTYEIDINSIIDD